MLTTFLYYPQKMRIARFFPVINNVRKKSEVPGQVSDIR